MAKKYGSIFSQYKEYDFTNPIVLSDADFGKIRTKAEQFVYYLSGHLSMFLRTEFNLELEDLTADLYYKFYTFY